MRLSVHHLHLGEDAPSPPLKVIVGLEDLLSVLGGEEVEAEPVSEGLEQLDLLGARAVPGDAKPLFCFPWIMV